MAPARLWQLLAAMRITPFSWRGAPRPSTMMHPATATANRRPRSYRSSLGILILLILIGGLYLNGKSELSIIDLYVAFYATSLAGLAFGVWPFVSTAAGSRWRAITLIAGAIVWRVAYFPVFVLAGWIATWVDWLSYSTNLPVAGIYPVFLLASFTMHLAVASFSVLIVLQRLWALLIPGVPLLALAILVSFNRPADFRILPDYTIAREPAPPSPVVPRDNVYAGLLSGGQYNPAQQVLLYSGLILYELIPAAPWSSTVKHVIAQGVLDNPSGSTADRVYEHYLAYLVAQPCLRRDDRCPPR